METQRGNNSTKLVVLAVSIVGAIAVIFMLRPKAVTEPPPQARPEPPPVVQQEPPPEPVVEAPKEEPPKVAPEEAKEMRETLLGTNKKEKGIAQMAERAASQKERSATRRNRKRPLPEEEGDDELIDSMQRSGGGLSDATFYATMERWRGVKSCLASGTTRNDEVKGELKGALRIKLEINTAGEVTQSEVFEPSNDVAKLIAPCVERSAKQIKFPSFTAEAPAVTKVAKFVF